MANVYGGFGQRGVGVGKDCALGKVNVEARSREALLKFCYMVSRLWTSGANRKRSSMYAME